MAFNLGMKGDELRARSLRSTLLTGLSFGFSNLLRLGGNLILTRILFPEAFGTMALVMVVIIGLTMFSDVGINASIVQNERGADQVFLDTAWMMQIGRGLILWAATWILAKHIAAFYETPILADVLPVAGLVAVFQGFNSTKLALANRNLLLGRVTMIEVGSSFLGLVVLISLALILESVWALVIGMLVSPFIVMVLSHVALPGPRNRLNFEVDAAHALIRFGKYIFLSTLAGFLISQADRAILGKFVTLTDLAIYNIAFMFASIPIMLMQKINSAILFPLYSRKPPGDSTENFRNIAKARWLTQSVTLAMLAVLAIWGNQFIIFLYDPRYEAAGVLVVLIALASTQSVITGNYGAVLMAAGNSRGFAILVFVAACITTSVLFWAVIVYGLIGAALAPLLSGILFYPILIFLIRPYGAWMPKQDIAFSIATCLIWGLSIWCNADALQILLVNLGFIR